MTVKIDASNQILGRLATKVAVILRGKDKVSFLPHLLGGEPVLIFNAEKIKVTGNKTKQKAYYRHSGFIGHLKKLTFEQVFAKSPEKVIRHAVAGMLPKNRLRQQWLKNLAIIKGPINEHN